MKKFEFRVNNDHEMNLMDKCLIALKEKNISYTASFTENAKNENVIIVSTVNMG